MLALVDLLSCRFTRWHMRCWDIMRIGLLLRTMQKIFKQSNFWGLRHEHVCAGD